MASTRTPETVRPVPHMHARQPSSCTPARALGPSTTQQEHRSVRSTRLHGPSARSSHNSLSQSTLRPKYKTSTELRHRRSDAARKWSISVRWSRFALPYSGVVRQHLWWLSTTLASSTQLVTCRITRTGSDSSPASPQTPGQLPLPDLFVSLAEGR